MVGGVFICLSPFKLLAITWDFNKDNDARGWIAIEGYDSGVSNIFPILNSEVSDGVWRVQVVPYQEGRQPSVMIISPHIGHDAALFDRIAIRFRLVHTQPVSNYLSLTWTNAHNWTYFGQDPGYKNGGCPPNPNCLPRFTKVEGPVVFTTDWQEVVIDNLQSGEAVWPDRGEYNTLWDGELSDISISINFVDQSRSPAQQVVRGPGDVPEALEIDWIQLTGVEEQIQGELPPPNAVRSFASGVLFSAPVFYPLGVKEVGGRGVDEGAGGLGDLDGDGDLDLVARWYDRQMGGYLLSFNDGQGRFARTQVESFPGRDLNFKGAFVSGGDLNGDGRMDLVLASAWGEPQPQVRLNDPEEGWVVQKLPVMEVSQMIDMDGDGDLDLWGRLISTDRRHFLFNDGQGNFNPPTPPMKLLTGRFIRTTVYPSLVDHKVPLLWYPPVDPQSNGYLRTQGYLTTYLSETGDLVEEPLPGTGEFGWGRPVQFGDFDLDGHTDIAICDTSEFGLLIDSVIDYGLNFLRNRGDGQFDTVSSFPELRYSGQLLFQDLNRDGILDVVLMDTELSSPAVVVLLGQGEGRFVKEGQYPLEKGRGGTILAGDLDEDGDVDLVVFDSYVVEGGGVHVMLNRLSDRVTAVEERTLVVPAKYHLGAAYPNPFNPGVVIPFTLGSVAEQVSLTIYSILGQKVRRLELGVLPAGARQVEWDGRDEKGEQLSSGVYVYRLQAGAWSATGRVVKSE
jgi:hypothetical protein